MVQHMSQERAQDPSLLVEHQPATKAAAPTASSLAKTKHAAAKHDKRTIFNQEVTASILQS